MSKRYSYNIQGGVVETFQPQFIDHQSKKDNWQERTEAWNDPNTAGSFLPSTEWQDHMKEKHSWLTQQYAYLRGDMCFYNTIGDLKCPPSLKASK